MIIKTLKSNDWGSISSVLYGQENDFVICEVSEVPIFEHEELMEEYSNFTQRCVPLFKEWQDEEGNQTFFPSIAEIKDILEKINVIGETGRKAKDMEQLNLMYEVALQKLELDLPSDDTDPLLTMAEKVETIGLALSDLYTILIEKGVLTENE